MWPTSVGLHTVKHGPAAPRSRNAPRHEQLELPGQLARVQYMSSCTVLRVEGTRSCAAVLCRGASAPWVMRSMRMRPKAFAAEAWVSRPLRACTSSSTHGTHAAAPARQRAGVRTQADVSLRTHLQHSKAPDIERHVDSGNERCTRWPPERPGRCTPTPMGSGPGTTTRS